jgi:cystathionine beta-lyase/cystathionine gamma-synthase
MKAWWYQNVRDLAIRTSILNTVEHRYVRLYVGLEDAGYLIADLDPGIGKNELKK